MACADVITVVDTGKNFHQQEVHAMVSVSVFVHVDERHNSPW